MRDDSECQGLTSTERAVLNYYARQGHHPYSRAKLGLTDEQMAEARRSIWRKWLLTLPDSAVMRPGLR